MTPLYTAEALSTGDGRNGRVATISGTVNLGLAIHKEMGGSGNGANPEELFAAGYAACFHSALQMVACDQKVAISETSVGSRVHVLPNDVGGFVLAVTLEVVVPGMEHDQAQTLADAAHLVYPYSNATRGNIEVTVSVTDD